MTQEEIYGRRVGLALEGWQEGQAGGWGSERRAAAGEIRA